MRSRSQKLKADLAVVLTLDPKALVVRIAIRDHRRDDYIASEVLATIIRTQYGKSTGVLPAAVEEFNRRLVEVATKRLRAVAFLAQVRRRGNQVVQDAVHRMWDHLLNDQSPLSNAETAFIVFVRDRFEEYVRHLGTIDNDMDSVDGMAIADQEGNKTSLIDTLVDANAETPEEALIRKQAREKLHETLMQMPKIERDAFSFRTEHEYEWKKVAELLRCSIPTAAAHWQRAIDKLLGALK
jgi:RNA polymerase sigma factor (sigma-70 family)